MELSQPAKDFILALIQPDPVLSSKPFSRVVSNFS